MKTRKMVSPIRWSSAILIVAAMSLMVDPPAGAACQGLKGTFLQLTDAQLALTQAQNTESQALADYRIALARLDRAVGRR